DVWLNVLLHPQALQVKGRSRVCVRACFSRSLLLIALYPHPASGQIYFPECWCPHLACRFLGVVAQLACSGLAGESKIYSRAASAPSPSSPTPI
ncbi:MAG: hypothetical protein EZS28_010894, partial [Streblomastix strix]